MTAEAMPEELAENARTSASPSYWFHLVGVFWRLSPWKVALTGLLSWVSAAVPGLQVALTAQAVGGVAAELTGRGQGRDQVVFAISAMVALAVTTHVLGAVQRYLGAVLALELTMKISEMVMVKGTRMDLESYENADYYDRLERAKAESGSGNAYEILKQIVDTVAALVTLVSISVALFSWHPWAALLTLLSPLPATAVNAFYGKREWQVEYDRAQERRKSFYYQWITTSDHSFMEIKLFGLGSYFIGRYRELIDSFFRVDSRLARRAELWGAVTGLIGVFGSMGAITLAVFSAMSSGTIGELAGFLQAITAVSAASAGLLGGLAGLYQNALYTGNLFDFLTLPESGITGGDRRFPAELRHGIEFRDVTFVYPGTDTKALDGFSCVIPAGRCCAVVGHNGAGKSTLVKLLARLYEPTSGEILIDGHPIEEYDLDDLRGNIGIIFQDFLKYEMTARENIGFGRITALDDLPRITASACQSGADAAIEGLTEGYGTQLGRQFQDGEQLSVGQWQKVALARAFMRRAPILVLDEPTAAIDAQAEAEIFGRLRQVAADATALLIAHRFSTVRIADKIIVIENGRLAEEGTHGELMAQGGVYAHLFSLQAAGYLDEEPAV